MTTALIGHTGFVGGNLMRQARFDACFNSQNHKEMEGKQFEVVVCAGVRAVKWKANQEPDADLAGIQALMDSLGQIKAQRFILISTVDVYPEPVGVDEETPLSIETGAAYGRHRLMLERFVAERFPSTILRLPGLFGDGLKKNIIFDLMNNNAIDQLQPASSFQFYPLSRLWKDVQKTLSLDIPLLNVATEPVTVGEIAKRAFGRDLPPSNAPTARYDFRSRHASAWGRKDGYLLGREDVVRSLQYFLAETGL